MKFALISDIHANSTALKLVLDFIRSQNDIEKIYCLGDLVGLHTSPAECVDLMVENNVLCIAGNHDAGVTGRFGKKKFPWECWESIEWTRRALSTQQLKFLESLPYQRIVDRTFWMMHGIFGDAHHYMVQPWKHHYSFLRLGLSGIRLGFYGHIHKQTCFKREERITSAAIEQVATSQPVHLEKNFAYLINPGTIGHPRSNDTSASFGIVDLQDQLISFERIPYDYSAVLKRTLGVFPNHLSMYKRFGTVPI
jgi:predicted phosphodiesterase